MQWLRLDQKTSANSSIFHEFNAICFFFAVTMERENVIMMNSQTVLLLDNITTVEHQLKKLYCYALDSIITESRHLLFASIVHTLWTITHISCLQCARVECWMSNQLYVSSHGYRCSNTVNLQADRVWTEEPRRRHQNHISKQWLLAWRGRYESDEWNQWSMLQCSSVETKYMICV